MCCWRHRVREAHRRHHVRTGHAGTYTRQTVQTAQDAGRRGRGPANLSDPRVRRLRPARASGGRSYLCPRRRTAEAGRTVPAGRPADRGIAPFAGRTRDASLVLAAFAALDFPLTDVQVFHADRGRRVHDTGITSRSTCSTSKDRCRAGVAPTATPWSSRRIGC